MSTAATISTAKLEPEGLSARAADHVIASIRGRLPGPTLVILGGIHGNEPAGVLAANRALSRIQERQAHLRGEVLLLRGNTRALEQRVRYIDADLNRQWTADNVRRSSTGNGGRPKISERFEQGELLENLKAAVTRARGEVYFLDLHTTSAEGKPFATVGDTLRNRKFALNFPVTIVLGLEEQIDGTLLEYLNNLGVITMGFEAGQHEAATSVDHHEAVIWHALVATGNYLSEDVVELNDCRDLLKKAGGRRVVEVRYRHAIAPEDCFQMAPGYSNFQPVRRGQFLALDRTGDITANETGLILLPLYQALGDDGFFLGREVKQFWLTLSGILRKLRVGQYIHLLPGVRSDPQNENFFVIDTRIARILPLQVFHLLGFRRRRWVDRELVVSRRAYDVAGPSTLDLV